MNHAQKYLASLAKVIKSPNLPGLDKFVVKMYLAVTATNMYTQTSPDYTYAVKLVLINTCYGGGGGEDVTFYQFQILVCLKPLHIHIFYDHDDNNIPPTYPMRLLIKDILFINIQP